MPGWLVDNSFQINDKNILIYRQPFVFKAFPANPGHFAPVGIVRNTDESCLEKACRG
jgi:hypothetical protein